MSSMQTLEQAEGNGFRQPLVVHSFTECSSEGGKDPSLMELRFSGEAGGHVFGQWAVWQVVAQEGGGVQEAQGHRRGRRPAGDAVCLEDTRQVTQGKGASQRCGYLGPNLIMGVGRRGKRVLGRGKSKYEALMCSRLGNVPGRAEMRLM